MTDYTVRAKRWEKGWELHIDGVGVTQSHRLTDADEMARDYIEIVTGETPGIIAIVPELGGELGDRTAHARQAVRQASEAQQQAAAESRRVVRQLHDEGLTGRDIAVVLGLSEQRVSQLLRESREAVSA